MGTQRWCQRKDGSYHPLSETALIVMHKGDFRECTEEEAIRGSSVVVEPIETLTETVTVQSPSAEEKLATSFDSSAPQEAPQDFRGDASQIEGMTKGQLQEFGRAVQLVLPEDFTKQQMIDALRSAGKIA